MVLFMVLAILLLPHSVCNAHVDNCAAGDPLAIDHKYYQPGDFIVAAIISHIFIASELITFTRHPSEELIDELMVVLQVYQNIMALVFAIKEINASHKILPNVTLGFNIYNSRFMAKWTYLASMELLSTQGKFIPNYKCDDQSNLAAVIGGPNSDVPLFMASILGIYKIPQLIYGSVPIMNNNPQAVFSQRMFPNMEYQYRGIVQLLLHFKWMWIGVIYTTNDSGEWFLENVLPMFSHSGICIDFIEKRAKDSFSMENMISEGLATSYVIVNSTASVVVFRGEIESIMFFRLFASLLQFNILSMKTKWKVFIFTAQMEFSSLPVHIIWNIDVLHGAISFAVPSKDVLNFPNFLQSRNPTTEEEDSFLKVIWEQVFGCSLSNYTADENVDRVCTGEENLKTLPGSLFEMHMSAHSYSVYNALYAVAYALQSMHSSKFKDRTILNGGRQKLLIQEPWQDMNQDMNQPKSVQSPNHYHDLTLLPALGQAPSVGKKPGSCNGSEEGLLHPW
ncbi:vomeronasal type-2 receptor 26-like [Rhineura floridana]|uniref:vomeronasal type-2 receptor 26-like n=1 Tax=Rhineura floridana TaxID=261503 RepID=UPI002AC874DE|nr:vomeronasal type-2 receptor 26-like [Rhineura floridana]